MKSIQRHLSTAFALTFLFSWNAPSAIAEGALFGVLGVSVVVSSVLNSMEVDPSAGENGQDSSLESSNAKKNYYILRKDAAYFLANEGREPTPLFQEFLTKAKLTASEKNPDIQNLSKENQEKFDLELAKEVLNANA